MPGRGFASMDPERRRQLAQRGGRMAHEKGTAHEFDSEEGRVAGQKGGKVSGGRRRATAEAREARIAEEMRKDRP